MLLAGPIGPSAHGSTTSQTERFAAGLLDASRIVTDDARYAQWLKVELALVDALAERGEIPRRAAATRWG